MTFQPDFDEQTLTFEGVPRTVFRGGAGPAVIVMHEAPGLYPGVADFGRRVIAAGHTVFMPSLVGTPGKPFSIPYAADTLARACIMQEFTIWATRRASPVTSWLRALARYAHRQCGGPGVGAIGMCLTGGFALAMMVEDCVQAPVLSQPSLPIAVTPKQKRDLGIDDTALARIRERVARGSCVMGLRFTHDPLVPKQRFQRLRDELGDNFIAIEIDSSPANPHGLRQTAHSVLVYDLVDEPGHPTREALDRVLAFLYERLGVTGPEPGVQ